jgi:hypothetical protein
VPDDVALAHIIRVMHKLKRHRTGTSWGAASETAAYLTLRRLREVGGLHVVSGHVVGFEVGPLWYTDIPGVIELFVIRLDGTFRGTGSLRLVAQHLVDIATERGAGFVVAGDSGTSGMGDAYTYVGYGFSNGEYFKEIDYGK